MRLLAIDGASPAREGVGSEMWGSMVQIVFAHRQPLKTCLYLRALRTKHYRLLKIRPSPFFPRPGVLWRISLEEVAH